MSKKILFAAVAAAMTLSMGVAEATPLVGASSPAASVAAPGGSLLTNVQYRRWGGGWRGGPRWGGWRGPAIIGSAIIAGAIIADSAYRPRPGYYYDTYDYVGPYYYPSDYRGDPRVICARNFRSFEWNTGMYTTYHGERRLCPYLR